MLYIGVSRITESPLYIIEMKRLCKDVDITDKGLISRAVYACLKNKYKRNDVTRYFSQVSGLTENQIRCIHHRYGRKSLYPIVEIIISDLQKEIANESLFFPPIWYRDKIDVSSGKIRRIGIQNIKQQLYDYIAVEGMKPLLKRIGEYQYASIPKRGTTKGKQVISRWIKNRNMRYFAKLDVKKCFESINHDLLMTFLKKYIKNEKLVWLIRTLINSFEKGLSIGSYLSQYLCNLYMSVLYHYIMEELYKTRRGKRINLIRHCLIYMDDILLIGSRKRDMEMAAKKIIQKADEMGLTIKDNWQVRSIDETPIDMMGFKIYRTHTEIRGRIFLRVRRSFRRARKRITLRIAKKCVSYYGYLKHTDSKRIQRKWKVRSILRKCKGVIRNESKIYETATACQHRPVRQQNLHFPMPE